MSSPLCERSARGATCTSGPGGGPAEAVGEVDGRWYCSEHIGAAKAVASKRRDRGFGVCNLPGCDRPAVEQDGKCSEHRAGERAAAGSVFVVDETSGRGDHPYAPKRTEIYLAVFLDLGLLKVGKATPWTVRSRVKDASDKVRIRQRDNGVEEPITSQPTAWSIALFDDQNVLWAVSERIEHAAAGRLAHNVGATSVDHTEGKEWLCHDAVNDVDWQAEFQRAVLDTLEFLGHSQAQTGGPRSVS